MLLLAKAMGKSNDAACADAGISTRTLYFWLRTKPQFRAEYEKAGERAMFMSETTVMQAASRDVGSRVQRMLATFQPAA